MYMKFFNRDKDNLFAYPYTDIKHCVLGTFTNVVIACVFFSLSNINYTVLLIHIGVRVLTNYNTQMDGRP